MSAREDSQPSPRGGWRWGLLKLAVSATLLLLIVRRFSLAELRAELAGTHVAALLFPFGLIVVSNLLGAVQWGWILRSAGIDPGFGSILRAYVIGLFLNNFMLGSVGGDVFKVYTVGRDVGTVSRVAGATIVDRLVGLSALCALALVASAAALPHGHIPAEQSLLIAGFSVTVMAVAALVLHPKGGAWLERRIGRLPIGRWAGRLQRLTGQVQEYRARQGVLGGAFLVSLVVQAGRVVAHFCVGLAMGWSLTPTDFMKFFLVIPILGLLISLPISFGGWGVREWAGVALFAPLGHAGEEAVTLLAVTAFLTVAASLGGAVLLLGRPRGPQAEPVGA